MCLVDLYVFSGRGAPRAKSVFPFFLPDFFPHRFVDVFLMVLASILDDFFDDFPMFFA